MCSFPEYFVILKSVSDSDIRAALPKAKEMCFPVSEVACILLAVRLGSEEL